MGSINPSTVGRNRRKPIRAAARNDEAHRSFYRRVAAGVIAGAGRRGSGGGGGGGTGTDRKCRGGSPASIFELPLRKFGPEASQMERSIFRGSAHSARQLSSAL